MKQINSNLNFPLLLGIAMFSGICSCEAKTKYLSTEINLVASTPGDEGIKSLLAISPVTKVDFIRWNLTLTSAVSENQQFTLNITYGEAQPNTLGFKNGGLKKTIAGEYTISQDKSINGEVYHLKSSSLPSQILLVKLSDNIYHLLTHLKQLMVGNAGWSYTLNRKEPITNVSSDFSSLSMTAEVTEDTAQQIIFVGRTPCVAIAKEQNLTVPLDCIKLKWELILNRNPKTLEPATYKLRRTDHRQSDLTGKWTIKKGIPSNPYTIIIELDPDKPEQSISLLLGDENVAFLLAKDNNFFTGNENFSYTLNREKK